MPRAFPSTAALRQISRSPTLTRTSNISRPSDRYRICILCQRRTCHLSLANRNYHNSRSISTRSGFSAVSNPSPLQNGEQNNSTDDAESLINKPPDISTHYTIFPETIPVPPPRGSFSISIPDLRREFLRLQARAHPDKYPPGPKKQRAEALSSRINEAYRALSDPLSRAQYILASQHGIDLEAEDGAKDHPQDMETLMRVLEVQETIEEAQDELTVAQLKEENEERINGCVAALGSALDQGNIDEARKECVRLRFWYTIREGLREWEPGKGVRLIH
ncbi:Fe-S protein assembly co-chaperone HscB [Paracoccidioides brasiliensis Pb03]|nr:Fe-S protein assembly co-chaperone HscB [Paracoccidioides brasiliensis Pb03]